MAVVVITRSRHGRYCVGVVIIVNTTHARVKTKKFDDRVCENSSNISSSSALYFTLSHTQVADNALVRLMMTALISGKGGCVLVRN